VTRRLRLRHLGRDARGDAAVQFALLAPALLLLVIGTFEFAIVLFVGGALESAVLAASRFGVTGIAEEGVTREDKIRSIISQRTLGFVNMEEATIRTLIYGSFEDIGQPEPFTDGNGNGVPDPGEYADVNGNGQWDDDMGRAGLGGPDDIVLYEVEYETTGITGLMRPILGQITHRAAVAVRNEPF
jgi:hypothetical protein